ncbi:MAG: hypothetical protein Q8896_05250 [Bacteroidota bacterium]|nr:hypothetical protein [Bacteroidota bacterium]MDP4237385.1 hypothetical protein [Bacteroidota bacterium]
MKKLLLAAFVCVPFLFTSPAPAQVSVQINIGNPAVRPWPDGVWAPGYYVYPPNGGRRVWYSGRWKHDNGRHLGQNKSHGDQGRGVGKNKGRGRGNGNGHGN